MHFFKLLLLSLVVTKRSLPLLSLKFVYIILQNSLPTEEKTPCLRYKAKYINF
jgi:hypothetical protein